MGTREVYEEKLRSGNLYHDPTIIPASALLVVLDAFLSLTLIRSLFVLPPSLSIHLQNVFLTSNPLASKLQEEKWTITSVLHDATAVAGSGIGAMLSAVHGFNTGFPFIQKQVKGPRWLQAAVGIPSLLLVSGVSAAFGAYAVPAFVQLSVSSYYASWSASHYLISQATRYIEGDRLSINLECKPR